LIFASLEIVATSNIALFMDSRRNVEKIKKDAILNELGKFIEAQPNAIIIADPVLWLNLEKNYDSVIAKNFDIYAGKNVRDPNSTN
jgi:collagenase-like PrtC family protease